LEEAAEARRDRRAKPFTKSTTLVRTVAADGVKVAEAAVGSSASAAPRAAGGG